MNRRSVSAWIFLVVGVLEGIQLSIQILERMF